ncbi:hypothetical protein FGO68_gene14792 [Halteria grandinella]|uniref:Uncharacterized protein n=1 Tax=Halteria grandinella TaxID=5974 RepID=A0A8J8NW75_HALGN|nr:hypothetical protein FGO68_gene14792 [Halteria grandinella]
MTFCSYSCMPLLSMIWKRLLMHRTSLLTQKDLPSLLVILMTSADCTMLGFFAPESVKPSIINSIIILKVIYLLNFIFPPPIQHSWQTNCLKPFSRKQASRHSDKSSTIRVSTPRFISMKDTYSLRNGGMVWGLIRGQASRSSSLESSGIERSCLTLIQRTSQCSNQPTPRSSKRSPKKSPLRQCIPSTSPMTAIKASMATARTAFLISTTQMRALSTTRTTPTGCRSCRSSASTLSGSCYLGCCFGCGQGIGSPRQRSMIGSRGLSRGLCRIRRLKRLRTSSSNSFYLTSLAKSSRSKTSLGKSTMCSGTMPR